MNVWKKVIIAGAALLLGAGLLSPAWAAKKKASGSAAASSGEAKISSDPGSATVHEHEVLKWEAVDPPNIGKNDQFFFRGVFVDVNPYKDAEGKDISGTYVLTVLPIAILENNERSITFEKFSNGVVLIRTIPDKKWLKSFKKGNVVEVKQWYETVDQGGTGHARMVGYIFHQDVIPYPVNSQAFVKTPGLQMEQYLNALKGMEMSGDTGGDNVLKDSLDALASSAPNPAVKAKAAQLLSSMFGAQPSGKPLPKASPAVPEPTAKKGKKG